MQQKLKRLVFNKMGVKRSYFLVLKIVLLANYSFGQEMPSKEVISLSIQYHDPENRWNSLNSDFLVLSDRDTTALKLANNRSMVEWTEKLKDNRLISGGYIGDSCYVRLDGKPIPPQGEIDNFLLDCPQIIGRSNYWLYMYGLPMKLNDKQAIIDPKALKVNFLDKEYWLIKVRYEGSAEGERWQFYFDPDSYRFAIAQYFHPALGDDSEYIVYDKPIDIDGMVIPSKHSWYMLNNTEFIGFEQLKPRK